MSRNYIEFNNETELNKHLKYWSNACGELHYHGEYDLNSEDELPSELKRAYNELWEEGNGCYEYLTEYDGKYYIALISEFDKSYARDINVSMNMLYNKGKKNAIALSKTKLFKNTILVIGKETGFEECHEFIFLVPAMETKSIYDEIEKTIYENIWN